MGSGLGIFTLEFYNFWEWHSEAKRFPLSIPRLKPVELSVIRSRKGLKTDNVFDLPGLGLSCLDCLDFAWWLPGLDHPQIRAHFPIRPFPSWHHAAGWEARGALK